MLKFTGDFKSLQRFAEKVRKAPAVLRVVSEQMAEETIDLIREGFDAQTDPSGKPWAPLALRSGEVLSDTGRLKGSWHRKYSNSKGFGVASGVKYAVFHQSGTGLYGPKKRRIEPKKKRALKLGNSGVVVRSVRGTPARKMVPDGGKLPALWSKRLVETASEVLEEHFSGQ